MFKLRINSHKRALSQCIDETLHYIWDPIGISGIPQARDEYYKYLPTVQEAILKGKNKEELGQLLNNIAIEKMGLCPDERLIKRTKNAVVAIFEWKEYLKEKTRLS